MGRVVLGVVIILWSLQGRGKRVGLLRRRRGSRVWFEYGGLSFYESRESVSVVMSSLISDDERTGDVTFLRKSHLPSTFVMHSPPGRRGAYLKNFDLLWEPSSLLFSHDHEKAPL